MDTTLIVFDFDGTLANTSKGILATYHATARRLNIPLHGDDSYQQTIGVPLREGFRMLYPELDESQLNQCVDTYREIYAKNLETHPPVLYEGVSETLRNLHKGGITMAVASSRSGMSLHAMCEALGIHRYFSMMLGAEDAPHPKPAPDPVIKILTTLSCPSERGIVVGDMPVDIAMGAGSGCRTVGVTYGNSSRGRLAEAGATYIIDCFSQLTDITGLKQDAG